MFRNICNTFANCFKIPELKSRILFTLGVLAVCRLMAWIRIPGLNGTALHNYFNSHSQGGGVLGMYQYVQRRRAGALRHRRARHHAVYQRHDHHPVAHGGLAEIEQAGARRRRSRENHPIRTLSDRAAVFRQGLRDGISWENPGKAFGGDISRLVLFSDNHLWWYRIQTTLIHDDGHDVVDVAWRTNHRARHRQRRFTGHHHRHRGAIAAGGARASTICFRPAAVANHS